MPPAVRYIVMFHICLVWCAWGQPRGTRGQSAREGIAADDVQAHVRYLASDELEGRMTGTEGDAKAAAYIATQFRRYDLKPGGDNDTYMRTFEFLSAVKPGPSNRLSFEYLPLSGDSSSRRVDLTVDVDFRPLPFSSSSSASTSLVFAGHGISAPDKNYDDYRGLDVTGKAVVVLRFSPDGNDPHGELQPFSALREKARVARDQGAQAIIIVSGPNDDPDDELARITSDHRFASAGLPSIIMKRAPLEQIMRTIGRDLKAIQDSIQTTRQPIAFAMPAVHVHLTTEVEKVMGTSANVIGLLHGSDPKLSDEFIIIGAHFDHLGYGGRGSGSLRPDVHEIHNGADDNASGTAVLLEEAEAFSDMRQRLRRSIIFVAFSGEELGTLGSAYYVNNPIVPLSQTVAMINMDMIGRLENNELTVYGTATSPGWDSVLQGYSRSGSEQFTLKSVPDGFGPSDHSQFYGKNIPVLFFFTGTHGDYHTPLDDWEKLNYDGAAKIGRYVFDIVSDLNVQPNRPEFSRAPVTAAARGGDTRGFRVTLGVIPDYSETDEGMKIGGVRPNGPAERAGMKSGDVIVLMAGKKVLNVYDFMGILRTLKAGDRVEIEVKRDGKAVTLNATLEKRD